VDQLIDRVAAAADIDNAKASQAIAIIMSFLQEEGDSAKVAELARRLGVENLMAAGGTVPAGGMFGGGGLMGVAGKLQGIGLGMGQIQTVTRELAGFARERGAGDLIEDVARGIPGLSQFL